MLYLFLDESGDLGFDFLKKKPSQYFVVAILVVKGQHNRFKIVSAVRRTLRNKLNPKRGKRRFVHEIKGTSSVFAIKQYLYRSLKCIDFSLYVLVLPKSKVSEDLARNKTRVYNCIVRKLLDTLPIESADNGIEFIIDKSKSKPEITEFNQYIFSSFKARLSSKIPIFINHSDSITVPELQVIDVFAWGIFRKYELTDLKWYNCFKNKIKYEAVFNTKRAR